VSTLAALLQQISLYVHLQQLDDDLAAERAGWVRVRGRLHSARYPRKRAVDRARSRQATCGGKASAASGRLSTAGDAAVGAVSRSQGVLRAGSRVLSALRATGVCEAAPQIARDGWGQLTDAEAVGVVVAKRLRVEPVLEGGAGRLAPPAPLPRRCRERWWRVSTATRRSSSSRRCASSPRSRRRQGEAAWLCKGRG